MTPISSRVVYGICVSGGGFGGCNRDDGEDGSGFGGSGSVIVITAMVVQAVSVAADLAVEIVKEANLWQSMANKRR